ncbi:MAG: zinc metallopeptidase [Clostridia bacterium]|nr:zinc metallopeptidase [Clostridia bacterium]
MPFDFSYIIVAVVIMIVGGIASYNVKKKYTKYSQYGNSLNLTGSQIARRILDANGLYDIRIEHVGGELSDHYDPSAGGVRLSEGVYGSNSISAIGIAAHECGHAIQHAKGYLPNKIRTRLVPVTNICSSLAWVVILIGLALPVQFSWVATLGIIMYATAAVFSLVTLPVETNASERALNIIRNEIGFGKEETSAVKEVLTAAALTYVAALFSAVLQLLRIIFLVNRRR